MNKSSKENRAHSRIYRNFILTYHEKGKSTPKHHVSQVNNVSKGGVSFSSTHPVKEGDVLMVNLKTPFISNPIHLEGFVLECREKISGIIYEIRLKFQKPPEQVMAVLEKVVNYGKAKDS